MRKANNIQSFLKGALGLLLLLMLLFSTFSSLAEGVGEEISELDGSKIESIRIFWLAQDSQWLNDGGSTSAEELADKDHLFLSTSSDSALDMRFQVEIALSGQFDYAPGDITITIPAQIWATRSGSLTGGMSLSVPKAPYAKADFNWQLIDGNYVITNTKTQTAASKMMFQFTITGITPHTICDMSESLPLTARCEVVTNEGNTISMTSAPITAQIDTVQTASYSYKRGEVFENAPSDLPAAFLKNLPKDASEYVYVRWYAYMNHSGNQPFSLKMQDTLGQACLKVYHEDKTISLEPITEGIFLGCTNGNGECCSEEDGWSYQENLGQDIYHSSSVNGDHARYFWSAYDKSAFYVPKMNEPLREYVFDNKITWTVTESDPEVQDTVARGTDVQKVTSVSSNATVTYTPVRWTYPTGRFNSLKYTESINSKDHTYGYALNRLRNGEDVSMNFVISTNGYGYPWTVSPEYEEELPDDLEQKDYGISGWRQVTEDYQTFLGGASEQLTSDDFEFTSLRISAPSKYKYAKQNNGQYAYTSSSQLPTPDLEIEYQMNGDGIWRHAATAAWGSDGMGTFAFVNVDADVRTSGMTVYFPENTTDVRHSFTSNVYGGVMAEKSNLAAVNWTVYPTVLLKASPAVRGIAENLFAASDTPSIKLKNDIRMTAYGYCTPENPEGSSVSSYFYDYSLATLAGANYGVSLSKSGTYNWRTTYEGGDNDVEKRLMTVHYTITQNEQSNLTNRKDYDDAVAAGVIPQETSCVWYDLLPEAVTPVLDSVRLRSGDSIRNVYTIPDYRETGRILLVVEADLTPSPTYVSGAGYADRPMLKFDAHYTWDDLQNFGSSLKNYAAFESTTEGVHTLGTLRGKKGEPDDPAGGMNGTTPAMYGVIRDAMTDLDPNADDNVFTYAASTTSLSGNISAVAGVQKTVADDLVGIWTTGLDGDEQATVYEGGSYTYRLRVVSSQDATTSDIVLFDSVENYDLSDPFDESLRDPAKEADYQDRETKKTWDGDWKNKGQWRGTMVSVDLKNFVALGVAPRLYVSTVPGLQFADSTPGMTPDQKEALFTSGYYDLSNEAWQEVTAGLDRRGVWTVPDELKGKISAIAIDASKMADGSDFILSEGESVYGLVHMTAPDDEGDSLSMAAKGAYAHAVDEAGAFVYDPVTGLPVIDWEAAADPANNMYCFNNIRMRCLLGNQSSRQIIREDYTRVGIIPKTVTVKKVWQDQNNHDGLRPESVTVTLMRRAVEQAGGYEPVPGPDGQPMTVTLPNPSFVGVDETLAWTAVFEQVDMTDDEGNRYLFECKETDAEGQPIAGYTSVLSKIDESHFILTNKHPNEQVEVKGEKLWNDDSNAAGKRPESVVLRLLCNGTQIRTLTVRPDSAGKWSYSFGKLDRYAEGGEENLYTVEENYVKGYYAESEDYSLITNTYDPYGDLEIEKKLNQATEAAAENEFEFTVMLFSDELTESGEKQPVFGSFAYDVYELLDGEWTQETAKSGTLMSGGNILLKGLEKAVIHRVPSETEYVITEADKEGFTLSATSAPQGSIEAGAVTHAEFTNTYTAEASLQLYAFKRLTGHAMLRSQFRFELVDMTEGSEYYGQVVSTAAVGNPTNTQDAATGIITGTGTAAFGQLTYTQADAGKTFTYEIREVDGGKPGYTYDDTVYTVYVTVQDKGDGSMELIAKREDGTPVPGEQGKNLTFENRYEADGELTLEAQKLLEVRTLKDQEFTFELYEYDLDAGQAGALLQTKKNDADGKVVFDAIPFTQDQVNLDKENPAKYGYLIREKRGTDLTVHYSGEEYHITVTVYDNNDGTLKFAQDNQCAEQEYEDCEACGGAGIIASNVTGWYELGCGYDIPDVLDVNEACTYQDWWKDGPDCFCTVCRGTAYIHGVMCQHCMGSGFEIGKIASRSNGSNAYEIVAYVPNPNGGRYCAIIKGLTGQGCWGVISNLRNATSTTCEVCDGMGYIEGGITVKGEADIPLFTNSLKDGSISVAKKITGSTSGTSVWFDFVLKLTGDKAPTQISGKTDKGATLNLTGNAGEFSFRLRGGETATFDHIPAGTAYEVWENPPAGWTQYSSSNISGVVQPLETSAAEITNQYTPKSAAAVLRAGKTLDGAPVTDSGKYSFRLYNESGSVLQTKTNAAGGAVIFDKLSYSSLGTTEYTIREEIGNDSTIAYDATVWNVKVEVKDNGAGVYYAEVTYTDADGALASVPEFHNTTKPGSLTVRKDAVGATEASKNAAMFDFHIVFRDAQYRPWAGNSGKVMTSGGETVAVNENGEAGVQLHAGESVTLTGIPAGIRYTVTESGSHYGWTMDTAVREGTIGANAESSAVFTNQYSASGSAEIRVEKQLAGRAPKEGEFTFHLYAVENGSKGALIAETTNNAADLNPTILVPGSEEPVPNPDYGKFMVVFSDLTYSAEGTYSYIVEEVPGTDPYMNYSDDTIFVTVKMTDLEGVGRLTPEISYGANAPIIHNSVKTGKLALTKRIEGPEDPDTSFTFTVTLTDADGNAVSATFPAVRTSEGNLQNEDVVFSSGEAEVKLKAGEKYTIDGLWHGTAYRVTELASPGYTVSASGAFGSIEANEEKTASFTNTYHLNGSYTFVAQKTLNGEKLEPGQFTFRLTDEQTGEVLTAQNDVNGVITFPTINFTEQDLGTRCYLLAEVNEGIPGVVYDSAVYVAELQLKDAKEGRMEIMAFQKSDDEEAEAQPWSIPLFRNEKHTAIDITAEKVWVDTGFEDLRPEITLVLYKETGGVRREAGSQTIRPGDPLTVVWKEMPVEEDGQAVFYTVAEEIGGGLDSVYSSVVIGSAENGFTVTNTTNINLAVRKTVNGSDGDKNKKFSFTVTLNDKMINGTYGGMSFVDGVASFELTDGECVIAGGLPNGVEYIVTEADYTRDGYVTAKTGDTGIIDEEKPAVAAFTNTRDVSPYTYKFSFTKKWDGGTEDSINWTMYKQDGTVAHKAFNKKVRSETEWYYEAWFQSPVDYYIVEDVPEGYVVRYQNVGEHADETDRCYNGGTIINVKAPQTGDGSNILFWIGLMVVSVLGVLGGAITDKKTCLRKLK